MLDDLEISPCFIKAQDDVCYSQMLTLIGKPFAQLRTIGELIEDGPKNGDVVDVTTLKVVSNYLGTSSGSKKFGKRKEKK